MSAHTNKLIGILKELGRSPQFAPDEAQTFMEIASRLTEVLDYADNLERGLTIERATSAQYEKALSEALDKSNELTERVVVLEDLLRSLRAGFASMESIARGQ